MPEIPLLKDILIVFGLAIAVLFICHRLRVQTVVGFLLSGIFVGPYGLGLIKAIHEVEVFAEVGVVLGTRKKIHILTSHLQVTLDIL